MLWNFAPMDIRLPANDCMGSSRPWTKFASTRPALSAWFIFAVASVMGAPRSMAHHSGAMFNQDKQITLAGTVKQFQWTNPHCWIQVTVPGDGSSTEWSIQMGAPTELFRGGWRPRTLKAGDKI
ncbi:MAG TPA: DUF6152 family protein [Steroidobacteraceae bacterium]